MANIGQVLKEEIARLAKKQVRKGTVIVRARAARLRGDIAGLKRQVLALQRDVKALQKLKAAIPDAPMGADERAVQKARPTGKLVIRLRRRFGMSQEEFGKLLGVSRITVHAWEKKTRPIRFNGAAKQALLAVKRIGKKEAARQLAALSPKKQAKRAKRVKRGKRK